MDKVTVQQDPYSCLKPSAPEVTLRGIIIGSFLAIFLAITSLFIGLKFAHTISGAIPAAFMSIILLKKFKNAHALESNIVQTIASGGEAVTAAVIFTIPALVITGHWEAFGYIETALVAILGSILGVVFSIPLRNSMIMKEKFKFPEGEAIAEILKAGENTQPISEILFKGGIFGAVFSFLQSGLKIAAMELSYYTQMGKVAFGACIPLSPTMMAAGYIIGLKGLLPSLMGAFVTWGIGIPLYVALFGLPEATDLGMALISIQKEFFRYLGLGVLIVAGLWQIVHLLRHIKDTLPVAFTRQQQESAEFIEKFRTQYDIPFRYRAWMSLGVFIITFFLFLILLKNINIDITTTCLLTTCLFATIATLLIVFGCVLMTTYIVGMMGTTCLPISGITVVAIIGFTALLLAFLGQHLDNSFNFGASIKISALVIICAGIVCVASTVSAENMQCLKAGQLLGATPWKQQVMLIIGALIAALVIPIVLQTAFEVYGIGDVLPKQGMDPHYAMAAPQANFMSQVIKSIFEHNLQWKPIYIGMGLGILAIIVEVYLKRCNIFLKCPILLFALGIYVPLSEITGSLAGGLISYLVIKAKTKKTSVCEKKGLLLASGIIAGEAILGSCLTISFAHYDTINKFALNLTPLFKYHIGIMMYLGLCFMLYRETLPSKRKNFLYYITSFDKGHFLKRKIF